MSQYFPEPKSFGRKIKVEADFKNATGIDTSRFVKKVHLASLKSNTDKLVTDELKMYHIILKIKYLILLI